MKKLFSAIRKGDLSLIEEILKKKPELICCIAKQPPKKDDGQSLLQVAIKTGHTQIAQILLDNGADVNFMEKESCNEWRMPVLHDAIRAAVFSSRYLKTDYKNGTKIWVVCNSKEKFDATYHILSRILNLGADIHSHDSFGNSSFGRAILDARQILPTIHYYDPLWVDDRPLNKELKKDLLKIFSLLIKKGANVNEIDERRGKSLAEAFRKECVAQFIKQ